MGGIKTSDCEMIPDLICRVLPRLRHEGLSRMAAALSPAVFVDCASSGREEPATMPAADFVTRREGGGWPVETS